MEQGVKTAGDFMPVVRGRPEPRAPDIFIPQACYAEVPVSMLRCRSIDGHGSGLLRPVAQVFLPIKSNALNIPADGLCTTTWLV